jgi:hypothetical protein
MNVRNRCVPTPSQQRSCIVVILAALVLVGATGCSASMPPTDVPLQTQSQAAGFTESKPASEPSIVSVAATPTTVPGLSPRFTTENGQSEAYGTLVRVDDGKGIVWVISADSTEPTSSRLPKSVAVITNPADLQLASYAGEYVRVRGLRMHGIDLRPGTPDMHVDEIVRATR